MTDTSSRGAGGLGASHLSGSHNPFDDPRPKRQKGIWIAIIIAVVVHAALAFYLWTSKINPNFKEDSDDVTDETIVNPAPPPPTPPPPPPPPTTPPAPP